MIRILAIETSCDDTAISIVEFADQNDRTSDVLSFNRDRDLTRLANRQASSRVLSHLVSSQIEIHRKWGGIVPNIAKREHQLALVPLLRQALTEANLFLNSQEHQNRKPAGLEEVLNREPELLVACKDFLPTIETPEIDVIAVTTGPGLEPALWVGLNFAKALATVWQKPLIPINHMEGHLYSSLLQKIRIEMDSRFTIQDIRFPAVVLLISGGHTELVLMKNWLSYKLLGQTRDDAVGEAFDKVARLLGLPYPGGPQISALAEIAELRGLKADDREWNLRQSASFQRKSAFTLPRPMIDSPDLDFSFSGLKTAVRYLIDKLPKPLSEEQKIEIAYEFEQAVTDVIISKTQKAIEQTGVRPYRTGTFGRAQTLLVGGGVIANKRIRASLGSLTSKLGVTLHLPEPWLTGDNATMIALAGYLRSKNKENILKSNTQEFQNLKATGTLRLH